jgi:signal transduction histidine kinase
MEIAQAWDNISSLLGLSAMTVLAVCLLVFLSISRALRPATIIVAGLESMEKGNLAERLPSFELIEWQRTAKAVNQLAASQLQLLAERQKLTVKLINFQEEERRFLARELHDEFGQCLAAINAVAASIAQTAKQQCPALVGDADHISRITQHMLDNVRNLLKRLRPAEPDELGLAASLNSLVSGWNAIRIKLSATNLGQLLADNVARIRKAVQIRYLLPNQLPGREAFSLLLEQPF